MNFKTKKLGFLIIAAIFLAGCAPEPIRTRIKETDGKMVLKDEAGNYYLAKWQSGSCFFLEALPKKGMGF